MHGYLCSRHSRYPVTAIHTWQALKMHKETQCPLETHPSSFHSFLDILFLITITTLKNALDDYSSGLTVSPLGPGRPGIPGEPCGPCRARGRRQNRDSYRVYSGHVKEIRTTSMLVVINVDSTHSVSLGTYFSWRSSLSLVTLHKNKIVFM